MSASRTVFSSRLGRRRVQRIARGALIGLTLVSATVQSRSLLAPVIEAQGSSGTPTFQAFATYSSASTPQRVTVGDANRDGAGDVLTANTSSSASFLGNVLSGGHATGTLAQPATVSAANSGVHAVAAADFNGDGKGDLAVATGGRNVGVMMGNGDGTFGALTQVQTLPLSNVGAYAALNVAAADVNHDGKADIVVSGDTGCVCQAESFDAVLYGNGDGTFQPFQTYGIPWAGLGSNGGVQGLALADFDHTATPLAVVGIANTGGGSDAGSIWLLGSYAGGSSAYELATQAGVRSATGGEAIAAGDLNHDGMPDIVATETPICCSGAFRGVSVYLNHGNGGVSSGVYYADPTLTNGSSTFGSVQSVAVADMNGDGYPDIVTADAGSSSVDGVSIYLNSGSGTFGTPVFVSTGGFSPTTLSIADISGDGKPDIVLASNTTGSNVGVLLNATPGPFLPIAGPMTTPETLGGGNPSESCQCELYTRPAHAEPVSTVDGNFAESYSDLTIPGRGFPLNFVRTYNSLAAATNGPLGFGWTDSYNALLTQDPNTGMVTVTQENGSQVSFAKTGTGSSASYAPTAPRVIATLTQNSDGSWAFVRKADKTLKFSSAGLLTSIADRNGYTTTLAYNASNQITTITDPANRSLTLGYTGSLLTSITDPTGRVVQYGYSDGMGNLTDVTDVNGGNTHFGYDTTHHVTTIRDPRGNTVTTNHYDASNRIDYQLDGLQRQTTFTYAPDGSYTITTDPKGNQVKETFSAGVLISTTSGYGTAQAATWTYTYDPYTLGPIAVTDPNGHTLSRTYDASGNPLTVTDALGHTTSFGYNPFNQTTMVTDPKGVTTTMTYDANGNPVSSSTPLVGTSPLQHAVTTNTYGDSSHPGDITAVTDPNNQQWSRSYDTYGDLASTSDPLQHVTTYAYNTIGWLQSSVSPRGNTFGADPTQFTTTYSYADPVTGTTDEFGDVRVVTNPLGHSVTTSYDADRNVASVKDGDGNTTTYQYDAANERSDVHRADSTILHTDFNLDGTVKDQVDGAGNMTSYGYDALARVTSVTDPLTRTTSYTYDGAGNLLTQLDPVSGASCTATPQVGCTSYGYDVANEKTSVTYSDGSTPNVTYGYDADGQRTSMTDGTGNSSWTWDSLHRMTASGDGAGNTVQYGYDLRGSLTSLTYPGVGTPVQYGYDAAGRMDVVTDLSGNNTYINVDADNNVKNISLPSPNQGIDFFTYDNADQLSSQSYTIGNVTTYATLSYGRDGNGQVTSETDTGLPAPAGPTYGYTPLNQVSNASGAPFSYDSADNPTQLANGTTQAFDAANQLCWTSPSGGSGTCGSSPPGAIGMQYDTRGNRLTGATVQGGPTTFGYDQANRLVNASVYFSTSYDGDGLMMTANDGVGKTDVSHQFVYDVHGSLPQMLVDATSSVSGNETTRYIYGPGGQLLEQVTSSGTNYYHHDQLGSIRALTDTNGNVAATYTYTPYGSTSASTGSVTNPFLFGGQYQDSQTGLYYLRARWYDPSTAQFISRDPAAWLTKQPYAYASGDPINAGDPSGLNSTSMSPDAQHCDPAGTDPNGNLVTKCGNMWSDDAGMEAEQDYHGVNGDLFAPRSLGSLAIGAARAVGQYAYDHSAGIATGCGLVTWVPIVGEVAAGCALGFGALSAAKGLKDNNGSEFLDGVLSALPGGGKLLGASARAMRLLYITSFVAWSSLERGQETSPPPLPGDEFFQTGAVLDSGC